MDESPVEPSYELVNADADGPVILSVPHAGRDYAPELAADLRTFPERLRPLEDRFVDLIARGVADVTTLIALKPRVWIDLNRSETDFDPGMIDPPVPAPAVQSEKVRGGLGLVPRRLAGIGELWRGRLAASDLARRIAADHRPYHTALDRLLQRARTRYGVAVLIDLHSMPPLSSDSGAGPPGVVIGDRFGGSASLRFTTRAVTEAEAAGLSVARNRPYAGGHIVERHGRPSKGVHALQLEIDRSLYLTPGLADPDSRGIERMRAFLTATIGALTDEALHLPSLAAE